MVLLVLHMLVVPVLTSFLEQIAWVLWRIEEETMQPVQLLMKLAIFLEVIMMETEEQNPAVVDGEGTSCPHLPMGPHGGHSAQSDN